MEWKFQSNADYENFLTYLKSLTKEESVADAERHKRILNTDRKILALSMSEIRRISKEISKCDADNFLKLAKDDTYEEVLIQGLVICNIKDVGHKMELIDKWKDKIDSWALCDSVVATMKFLNKSENKEKYFEYFYNLCFSEKEFISRFGIVTLMTYYIEEKYIDDIYLMCEGVKCSEYYTKMAVAWLISYGFISFREKTYRLLESKKLDAFTQNKAISKCRDSFRISHNDKEKLKLLRK